MLTVAREQGTGMTEANNKELKNVLAKIEKDFGKGAIMTLGEQTHQDIEGISTGALSLDIALGGRGLPRGRIIEIYGPESSGKTTVALHAVANAQKMGGVAAYIDAEHALDPTWAKRIGIDLDALLVSQPSCGEEALQIAEMLVKSNAVDVIVIDSVSALVPKTEIEGNIEDNQVGLQARLMSKALRMLNPTIAKTRTSMIFINQIRQKVGVMFGSPETTSGGLALRFYSSVRLEIRRISTVKEPGGEDPIGSRVQVKVVKNKVAPPFRKTEFDLLYDQGISWEGDMLDLSVDAGVIDKSGTWFSYGNQRLGQGRERVREFLRENPTIVEELRNKILEKRGLIHSNMALPDAEVEAHEAEAAEADTPEEVPTPTPASSGRGRKKSSGS